MSSHSKLIKQIQRKSIESLIKADKSLVKMKEQWYKNLGDDPDDILLDEFFKHKHKSPQQNKVDFDTPFYIHESLKKYYPFNLVRMAEFAESLSKSSSHYTNERLITKIRESLSCTTNQAKAIRFFIKLSQRRCDGLSIEDKSSLVSPYEIVPCQFPRLRAAIERLCNIRDESNDIQFNTIANMLEAISNENCQVDIDNFQCFYGLTRFNIEKELRKEGFSETNSHEIIKFLKSTKNAQCQDDE